MKRYPTVLHRPVEPTAIVMRYRSSQQNLSAISRLRLVKRCLALKEASDSGVR